MSWYYASASVNSGCSNLFLSDFSSWKGLEKISFLGELSYYSIVIVVGSFYWVSCYPIMISLSSSHFSTLVLFSSLIF